MLGPDNIIVIDIDRTSDPESLRVVIRLLDAEVRRLQARVKHDARILAELSTKNLSEADKELERRIRLLEEELTKRREFAFSGGSERRPRKDNKEGSTEEKEKKKPSKKGSARTEQKELPVEEVVQELDPADRACPCCGEHMAEWQGKADESEVIDVVEVRYSLKMQKRCKYRCRCGHIETALGIPKLTPGGRYSIDFGIHVVLSRYVDQIPLDRLRKIMARSGLAISSQTLWDQVYMVASLLSPAKARLLELIQRGEVALGDETRWPLLGGRSGKGLKDKHETQNWYIWALVSDLGVVYEIQDSRSNDAGRRLLGQFRGTLVADGYVVYRSLAKEGAFVLAHDWTHVRRRFLEAEVSDPELAVPFINDIGQLFLIEREIDATVEGHNENEARAIRRKIRQERSKPIVARIGQRAAEVRVLKDSPIGQALTYLENRWDGLQIFLTKPKVPITSNGVERALRDPVVGRKISLGSRSERGIEAASILYSLLQSAKHCGVDPPTYLRAALRAALDGAPIPLPHELR